MQPIVNDWVAWSVCRSVTLVSPAKTDEPIEMPFELRTRVGSGNHVLHGGQDPPMGSGNSEGGAASHCIGTLCSYLCKTAESSEIPFGLWAQMGPRNHLLDAVQITPWKGAILEERHAHCKVYRDFLPWAVKMAEPIDLPFGLWTQVGWRNHKFNHIRKVAPMRLMGGHIGVIWQIWLTVHLQRRCSLMSKYFDHLSLVLLGTGDPPSTRQYTTNCTDWRRTFPLDIHNSRWRWTRRLKPTQLNSHINVTQISHRHPDRCAQYVHSKIHCTHTQTHRLVNIHLPCEPG